MFSGKVEIESVDYERTLRGLFPVLLENKDSDKLPTLIRKVLNKMDGDLLPVLLKLIGYMNETEREALLLWALENYKEQIISWLMQLLRDNNLGDAVRFERINLVKTEGIAGFTLEAFDVQLDYDALGRYTQWSLLGLLKYVEKPIGRFVFNSQLINGIPVDALSDFLQKKGLYLKIRDIVLVQDKWDARLHGEETVDMEMNDEQTGFKLPEVIEDILVDTVVNYLKDTGTAWQDSSAVEKKLRNP